MREQRERTAVFIRHVVRVHADTMVAADRVALHQQVTTAVRADMAKRYRREALDLHSRS